MIHNEVSFFDADGGYDIVLLGPTQLWLVGFDIKVDLVVVKIFLEEVVVDIALHAELTVVIECPVIPDLRTRVESTLMAADMTDGIITLMGMEGSQMVHFPET